jgi:integrase/recombinase XerC
MLRESLEKFLDHLRLIKQASAHTLRNYRLDLTSFLDFLDGRQVDRKLLRSYFSKLHEEGCARRTVLRRLSSLRSYFKHLVKEKVIVVNPMDELQRPKLDKTLPKTLTLEEIKHFFSQPDVETLTGLRDRAIMELFYSSGLRLNELAQLSRNDIDWKGRRIKVRGKGKKERLVPVTPNAFDWLKRYLDCPFRYQDHERQQAEADPEAVFLNRWGKRLTPRSIDRLFKEYLRSSGLAGRLTPHALRHSIATHLLEKGMDLKTIQVLLGHSALTTTTIYTQVSTRLRRETYEKTHPLEKE